MYDWANSAYSTIYITVLVLYLQGAVLKGDAGLTAWGWGIGITTLCSAILSPILGAIADAHANKRTWLFITTMLGAGASALDVLRHARSAVVVRGDVPDRQSELRVGAKLLQRLSARDRRRPADERGLGLGLWHRLRRRRPDAA